MNKRALTLGLSAVAVVGSIALLATKGVEYGLDFRGGTLTYVRFEPQPPIDDLRHAVSSQSAARSPFRKFRVAEKFIIGSELADEQELDRKRQAIRQALERSTAKPGQNRSE